MSSWTVILISGSAAAAVYLGVGVLTDNLIFDARHVMAGLLGGILNGAGSILLLRAYARGKLGVASSVSTSSVLVPLGFSFAIGQGITIASAFGIVVILVGLATFAAPGGTTDGIRWGRSLAPMALALGSAVFYGAAIIVLDIRARQNIYGTMAMSESSQFSPR